MNFSVSCDNLCLVKTSIIFSLITCVHKLDFPVKRAQYFQFLPETVTRTLYFENKNRSKNLSQFSDAGLHLLKFHNDQSKR